MSLINKVFYANMSQLWSFHDRKYGFLTSSHFTTIPNGLHSLFIDPIIWHDQYTDLIIAMTYILTPVCDMAYILTSSCEVTYNLTPTCEMTYMFNWHHHVIWPIYWPHQMYNLCQNPAKICCQGKPGYLNLCHPFLKVGSL